MMDVQRTTLLCAPHDSLLHRMFAGGWDAPLLSEDQSGRIFLDMPPKPFKRVVDHLRLLRMAPRTLLVKAPQIPSDELAEFIVFAKLLGVDEFLSIARHGCSDDIGEVENPT